MNKQEHQVDKAVREGLGKLQVKAPSGSWKAVERRLERENKRRSLMIFIPWAASIALAMLVGMLFYDFPVALYSHEGRRVATEEEDSLEWQQENGAGGLQHAEKIASLQENGAGRLQHAEKIASLQENGAGGLQHAEKIASLQEQGPGAEGVEEQVADGGLLVAGNTSAGAKNQGELPSVARGFALSSGLLDTGGLQRENAVSCRVAGWPVAVESEMQPVIHSSFEIGGNAAPLYSFRNSSSNSTNEFFTQTGGLENQNREHGILSYSGGVDVSLTRSRWTFSSGVYLSRVGQEIENVTISKVVFPNMQSTSLAATSVGNVLLNQARSPISVDDINSLNYAPTSDFQSVTTEEINASLQSSFNFVELPLTASYQIVSKPVEISVISGLSLAIMYKNQVQLSYQNNISSLVALSNLNTLNYNTMAGVKLAFPISKSLKFHFQPLYRQSLSPLNKDFVVNYYLYSFSLLTGVSWSF